MSITISAGDVAEYHGVGHPAKARLYANVPYTTAEEEMFVAAGSDASPDFYQEFDCSLVGDNIRIESGPAYTSVDSDVPDATHTLCIYDDDNVLLLTVYTNLKIPAELDPVTWFQLKTYSNARRLKYSPTYLSTAEIWAVLGNLELAPYASDAVIGKSRLTYVPADLFDPIAVGAADPRWTALTSVVFLADDDYGHTQAGVAAAIEDIEDLSPAVVELVITENVAITSTSPNFPVNCVVNFQARGKLTVSSGRTVTIHSMKSLEPRQYFFGAGNVILGKETPRKNIAYWAGSGSGTNDKHAFDQMFASLESGGSGSHLGGGIGEVGRGHWYADDLIVPAFCRIVGHGNDPDGVDGTVVHSVGGEDYIMTVQARCRMSSIENLTLSSGHSGTSAFKADNITDSGFHLTFRNCAFRSTAEGGVPTTAFQRQSGEGIWEVIGVVFERCWWQTSAGAGVGLYIHTQNSSFNLISPTFQVGAGSTGIQGRETGWITISNMDGRGNGGEFDYPISTEPLREWDHVAVTATYLNPTYSKITLAGGTPEADRFLPNDKGRPIKFDTTTELDGAYIVEILDAFNAVLSYHPTGANADQKARIFDFEDHTSAAYALIDISGALAGLAVEGGADEGFNYSLILGQAQFNGGAVYKNYTGQGRVWFTDGARFTDIGGTWGSGAFEDRTDGPAVIINLINTYIRTQSARGSQVVLREGSALGYYPNGQNYGPPVTRLQQAFVTLERYTDDLATLTHNNPHEMHQNIVHYWNGWSRSVDAPPTTTGTIDDVPMNLDAVFGIADTVRRQGSGDNQASLLRMGLVDYLTNEWKYFYDVRRNDYNGHLQIEGNQAGFMALDLLGNMDLNVGRDITVGRDVAIARDLAVTRNTTITGTLGITGNAVGTSIKVNTKVAGQGIGYGTGAGVSGVTQLTSRATAVTANGLCGLIQLRGDSLAALAEAVFTLNNSCIELYDQPEIVIRANYGTLAVDVVGVAAGSCTVRVRNYSTTTASTDAPIIQFSIKKGTDS